MAIIYEIVLHSFLIFAWLGCLAGVMVGAGLLLAPGKVIQLNRFLGAWIDIAIVRTELDRPRRLERYFYRNHKWTGALLTCGAAFVLYQFLIAHVGQKIDRFFRNDVYGLFDAFSAFIVIGCSLALFLGIAIFCRPSLLRECEEVANHWISTDKVFRAFDHVHLSIDGLLLQHPKFAAAFFLIGGSYGALRLGSLLLGSDWKLI